MRPRPGGIAVIAATLAVVVVVLAGCGSTQPSELVRESWPNTLAGTAWQAVVVAGRAPVAGSEPTALFALGDVSGTTGCNQYGAGYEYAAGEIRVADIASTRIGCDGAVGQVETLFIAALRATRVVAIDEAGRLVLSGPEGEIRLIPAPQGIPAEG